MFTDKEHRILLSAIRRERDVCKKVDQESCREPYEISLVAVCDSIERKVHDIQHKYRWHDLRKNPDDLPNNSRPVLVADINWNVCIRAYFVNSNGYGKWSQDKYGVIAWREIEPFEGEDG